MSSYIFSGTVHPERAPLTIDSSIVIEARRDDGSLTRSTISISNNQITVSVVSAEDDIFTLRNLVKSKVESLINMIGFVKGYAYQVEIIKVVPVEPDKFIETTIFGIQIPFLEARNTRVNWLDALNAIMQLQSSGIENDFLRRCFADLRSSMMYADDTPFYCFRAIECLRQNFVEDGDKDDKQSWLRMGKSLDLTKETTDELRGWAIPIRHGQSIAVTDQMRMKCFGITWMIAEKYMNFKLKDGRIDFRFPVEAELADAKY